METAKQRDRERATELANQIRNGGPCGLVADAMQIFKATERELILRGLDDLAADAAAAPDQTAEVREMISMAIDETAKVRGEWVGDSATLLNPDDCADAVLAVLDAIHPRVTPARPAVGETWETPEGAVMVVPVALVDTLRFWLEGSLKCEAWFWDVDQYEAATDTLNQTITILAAVAKEPNP